MPRPAGPGRCWSITGPARWFRQLVARPPGDPEVEAWLADAFYSHPRLDGMFITDAAGRLLDSIPAPGPGQLGNDFSSSEWLAETRRRDDYYVSPVYPRIQDNRLCASIVASVRAKNGDIIGYIGTNILVERVGKRLAALNFAEQALVQVIDQTGKPLFDENLSRILPPGRKTRRCSSCWIRRTQSISAGTTTW